MTIHRQKRKSWHIENDGFDDHSIEAAELVSLTEEEKNEFDTVRLVKSSKSVSFAEVDEYHESDKTQEEVGLTWLTRHDIKVIRDTNKEEARVIKDTYPSLESSDNLCGRGLEHRDPERFKERRSNRRNASAAVMEEQDRQSKEGLSGVEAISRVYRQLTFVCQLEARERGISDAKDATAAASSIDVSPSSPKATIKNHFIKIPRFLKRGILENKRFQLLYSPEMMDTLKSVGSV